MEEGGRREGKRRKQEAEARGAGGASTSSCLCIRSISSAACPIATGERAPRRGAGREEGGGRREASTGMPRCMRLSSSRQPAPVRSSLGIPKAPAVMRPRARTCARADKRTRGGGGRGVHQGKVRLGLGAQLVAIARSRHLFALRLLCCAAPRRQPHAPRRHGVHHPCGATPQGAEAGAQGHARACRGGHGSGEQTRRQT